MGNRLEFVFKSAQIVVIVVFNELVVVFVVVYVIVFLMINKSAETKIRRLTKNQAKALKAVIVGTSAGIPVTGTYISTATGLTANALGGTVSALERNDFIQPLGKEERQFKWELGDPDIITARQEDSKALINIVSRVAGDEEK